MKKNFMKRVACMMALSLVLVNGIVAHAGSSSGYFTRAGSTAYAFVTGIGKTGGATTSITKGDYTKLCFAQIVPIKSNGAYMEGGNSAHQVAYVKVTCTAKNNNHKKFKGVHALKDSSYRPYGNSYSITCSK